MIDDFNSWMTSPRAGNTYLVLVGVGFLLYGIAQLFLRKNAQSQIGRSIEVVALGACGLALVLSVLSQSFNE